MREERYEKRKENIVLTKLVEFFLQNTALSGRESLSPMKGNRWIIKKLH